MIPVTTVILAGGQGRRIGGEKALLRLRGKPLVQWVLEAVRTQSDEVLINANANEAAYVAYGCRVVADVIPDRAGPLAGLQAAMMCARNEWVASVPCDTPFLPHDLIAKLADSIDGADAAVAVAGGRRHPTIALYRKSVLSRLNAYLASGERKAGGWLATLDLREAVFDDADSFANINTPEELGAFERGVVSGAQ